MKRLRFQYHMSLSFDMPVQEHHFTLKCLPQSDDRQAVESLTYDVYPNYFISRSKDSFGNDSIYGYCKEEHQRFLIDVRGMIQVESAPAVSMADGSRADIYKYQTEHTRPGAALREYHAALLQASGEGTLRRAEYLMHRLHRDMAYEQGVTTVATTAEEAMRLRKGVCQDYAHVLLSLCRMEKIPCRYVVGMMLGEGLSHAWVEVYDAGAWAALDPTNDCIIDDGYIKISCGRDYKDCLLNQGIFTGSSGRATQKQEISVFVEEIV